MFLIISLVFFYLIKLLFSAGFLKFKGYFERGKNNRDWAVFMANIPL